MAATLTAQTRLQRRLTEAFVNRAPVTIALEGVETVESLSGGKARTRLRARPPIIVTLVEPSDSGYRGALTDERGTRQAFDYQLVAVTGTDVREADEFDLDGHRYRVDTLMMPNDYEVRALVVRVH